MTSQPYIPKHRPDYPALARVLQLIQTRPNERAHPVASDVAGEFDFWFDGGAGRQRTGLSEYEFTDGTRVRFHIGGPPLCSCYHLSFASGWEVRVDHS